LAKVRIPLSGIGKLGVLNFSQEISTKTTYDHKKSPSIKMGFYKT